MNLKAVELLNPLFRVWGLVAVQLFLPYILPGPRAKTHTRKWKLAEAADPRYPYEEFPDIWLPPDIDKNPKADCWRILHVVPRNEKIIMEAYDQASRVCYFSLAIVSRLCAESFSTLARDSTGFVGQQVTETKYSTGK